MEELLHLKNQNIYIFQKSEALKIYLLKLNLLKPF